MVALFSRRSQIEELTLLRAERDLLVRDRQAQLAHLVRFVIKLPPSMGLPYIKRRNEQSVVDLVPPPNNVRASLLPRVRLLDFHSLSHGRRLSYPATISLWSLHDPIDLASMHRRSRNSDHHDPVIVHVKDCKYASVGEYQAVAEAEASVSPICFYRTV